MSACLFALHFTAFGGLEDLYMICMHSVYMRFFVFVLLTLSTTVHANQWPEFTPADIPESGKLRLGEPLSENVLRTQIYRVEAASGFETLGSAVTTLGFWNLWPNLMPEEQLKKIAYLCKTKFYHSVYEQIGCLGKTLSKVLRRIDWGFESVDAQNSLRFYCQTHARNFAAAFEMLGLPRSYAQMSYVWRKFYGVAQGHVASQFAITDSSGAVFAYFYDIGWKPDTIFPNSISSIRLYQSQGKGFDDIGLTLR